MLVHTFSSFPFFVGRHPLPGEVEGRELTTFLLSTKGSLAEHNEVVELVKFLAKADMG